MSELNPYVLIRANKKSGTVDTTLTGLGRAMLQMWALNNTPKTKMCYVINGVSGKVEFATCGTADGFPKVKREKDNLPTCDELGISLDDVQNIIREDGRFNEYLEEA